MTGMTLENVAKACHGQYIGLDELKGREVEGVAIDSRNIEQDFLFIPIVGNKVDGHDFIESVFEKGALCSLSEKELDGIEKPYILVDSTLQAIKDIAAYYRLVTGIKVVGVTGSVGKTSTKEMIASVLSQKYHVLKTEGNFNNEIGLPLTIFQIRPEHEIAVLEMGIDSFGEMHRLSEIAKPDVCVITNIGYCHLEKLGDRDGVLRAKSEIFDFINKDGAIILNGDDDKLSSITEIKGIRPLFFGVTNTRNIHAVNTTSYGMRGTNTSIYLNRDEVFNVTIPIMGEHMVMNAMAAAAVGRYFGLEIVDIKRGIESIQAVDGRNNIIKTGTLTIIDDCYNANPVSVKSSLDVLSNLEGNKVAILGDMLELGIDEVKLHEEVGRYAASKNIKKLICVGRLGEYIAKAASEWHFSGSIVYYQTKEAVIKALPELLAIDDIVLVKASHGMAFADIVESLKIIKLSDILILKTRETEAKKNIVDTVNHLDMAAKEVHNNTHRYYKPVNNSVQIMEYSEPKTNKTNKTAVVFLMGAIVLLFLEILNFMANGQFDLHLSYRFVLLAVIMVMLLCGIYGDKSLHIIRGISLLVLFEVIIIVQLTDIKEILNGVSSLRDLVKGLWYFSLGGWLLVEGCKSIFIKESKNAASIGTIFGIINMIASSILIILLYDLHRSTLFKVDFYQDIYMNLNIYLMYILFIIANIAMSWRCTERVKK